MAKNRKAPLARKKEIEERNEKKRKELWPEVPIEHSWNRLESDGYSTIPRTLTLFGTIANRLAQKNKRVSTTYFGLWCRVRDTGVVTIDNEYEISTEAGFSGERRIYTWRDRMKQLRELGFIKIQEGPKGPFQYVLIINPYHIVYELRKAGKVNDFDWQFVMDRSEEIGAKDIAKYIESSEKNNEEANEK